MDARPIGVIDAGMGGYTVVREVQRLMPRESIVYYGDSANQPYGNRRGDVILHMARQILDDVQKRGVKLVAVACNTISTLIDDYRNQYAFPVFSIVEAGARAAVDSGAERIGMISTVFTANSGCYERLIKQERPDAVVVSQGCPDLPRLIEHGGFDQEMLDREIKKELDALLARQIVTHLILGCTHFGYVRENILRLYPFLTVIDPSEEQARILRHHLEQNNALAERGRGGFQVLTTGSAQSYREAAGRMTLYPPETVTQVPAPDPVPPAV